MSISKLENRYKLLRILNLALRFIFRLWETKYRLNNPERSNSEHWVLRETKNRPSNSKSKFQSNKIIWHSRMF